MPGGSVLAIIFFVAVFFAAMTSLVNLYEAPIATLQDELHLSRPAAVAIIGTIGVVASLAIQGIISGWMDFVSIVVCPLGAALAGIMFAWVMGAQRMKDEVSAGRRSIGAWFVPLYKYVFCLLTVVVWVLGIVYGGIG